MMDETGDTLTYTLGAMKPESAEASVISADATAKQLALNKVGGCCCVEMDFLVVLNTMLTLSCRQISFA
jgi:hypothetical protein